MQSAEATAEASSFVFLALQQATNSSHGFVIAMGGRSPVVREPDWLAGVGQGNSMCVSLRLQCDCVTRQPSISCGKSRSVVSNRKDVSFKENVAEQGDHPLP